MTAHTISILTLLVGCTQEREDLPDWSEGYETTETTIDTTVGAYLKLSTPNDVGYDTITHPDGNWTSDCSVETDGSLDDYQEMTCYIEIEELDLYASSFQFGIEASGCDYVAWSHYMYEAWRVGIGATEVSYEIDKDGNIIDGVSTEDGVPYCPFNYNFWNSDHPNCCTGSYDLTITDSGEGKTVSYEDLSWGNKPWACYSGAAFIDPDANLGDDGWPLGHIVLTNQAYYSKDIIFDALAERFYTNVNLSNHYEPADHDGAAPAGITGIYAQPNYVIQCLDHAEEELARIEFVVREWNTEAEFALEETGDPDAEGSEPVSDSPLNDRLDWADATPGSVVYIGNAQ
ncbi:MAG: hypothetical protein ACI8RZ_007630 [Myxococcota bacterium]|jgi:hypothetical protein